MVELEELGYAAFAFGYFHEDMQFASTTTAQCWAKPQNAEYLHAIIVAGRYYGFKHMVNFVTRVLGEGRVRGTNIVIKGSMVLSFPSLPADCCHTVICTSVCHHASVHWALCNVSAND